MQCEQVKANCTNSVERECSRQDKYERRRRFLSQLRNIIHCNKVHWTRKKLTFFYYLLHLANTTISPTSHLAIVCIVHVKNLANYFCSRHRIPFVVMNHEALNLNQLVWLYCMCYEFTLNRIIYELSLLFALA